MFHDIINISLKLSLSPLSLLTCGIGISTHLQGPYLHQVAALPSPSIYSIFHTLNSSICGVARRMLGHELSEPSCIAFCPGRIAADLVFADAHFHGYIRSSLPMPDSKQASTTYSLTREELQGDQALKLLDRKSPSSWGRRPASEMDRVTRLAAQRAVVIFSMSSCCMCHTVTRLFCELGVNPTVVELDEDPRGKEMEKALGRLLGRSPAVPAVFIGGRLVGSTDKVMSLHLSGNLVPMLRNAGALWV